MLVNKNVRVYNRCAWDFSFGSYVYMQSSNLEEVTETKGVFFSYRKLKNKQLRNRTQLVVRFEVTTTLDESLAGLQWPPSDTTSPGVELEALPVSQLWKAPAQEQVQDPGSTERGHAFASLPLKPE